VSAIFGIGKTTQPLWSSAACNRWITVKSKETLRKGFL
jgi:hypothetical protein